MARIRSIKPEAFLSERLYDAEASCGGLPVRWAYAGLWTQADREGRFAWRPRVLKAAILPHDSCDFSAVLEALRSGGFILRYEADGESWGVIPSFGKHQLPNHREAKSRIPAPTDTVPSQAGPGIPGKDMGGLGPGPGLGLGSGPDPEKTQNREEKNTCAVPKRAAPTYGPQELAARALAKALGSSLDPCRKQIAALTAAGWDLLRIESAVVTFAEPGLAPWDWTKRARGTSREGLTPQQAIEFGNTLQARKDANAAR